MADAKDAKDAAKPKAKTGGSRPDLFSIGGLVVALGGILTGLIMDGGSIKDVRQVSAGLIVLGGTLGAVMITTPMSVLMRAVKRSSAIFFEKTYSAAAVIDEIVAYATQARKQGIVSLEQQADAIKDPFMRKALNLAIDGVEMNQLRSIMELEISLMEHEGEAEAKVFEAAGGYSPTIGIIGAVLGLMQVMKNLANIEEVGHGIAVAFVATVYGVGLANIFLLPAAAKVKNRARADRQTRELLLLGVLGILEGLNPKVLRNKLSSYLAHSGLETPTAKGSKRAARAA